MPDSRFLAGVVAGAAAVLVLGGVGTRLASTTESTTRLDRFDTVMVDGHKALAPRIVAGRTESLYHPLPWVGTEVDVSCPTGLKAVAGATLTCTGRKRGGATIDIPVTVISATDTRITWKFER
ncbi:DUF4333 domain-containing protein [Streptomyces lincolnensis]|uniref:DUF4333 domain-containing protein n=1 Tax=Streptomyces lincolnensis TaxID=1915 RepID=UPI001E4BBF0B|nr:DUF4333 domain-containing protein [Streptomyces lincolnensis]MCD7440441.1 DUF4333 domain-containing protein [Streptomyces lincolnensis]